MNYTIESQFQPQKDKHINKQFLSNFKALQNFYQKWKNSNSPNQRWTLGQTKDNPIIFLRFQKLRPRKFTELYYPKKKKKSENKKKKKK